VLRLPIAHGEGNYFAPPEVLDELEANRQVVFRYCDPEGRVDAGSNPNGSLNSIAGICNRDRNVVGLMPHPERASEAMLGSADGRAVLASAAQWLAAKRPNLEERSGVRHA
jgi:phosphoribosylformylglycinamidine synthase